MKDPLRFKLPKMGAGCGGSVLRNPMSSKQAAAVEDALAALAERDEAFLAGDAYRLSELMTDDYVHTDTTGCNLDKKTWMTGIFEPLAKEMRTGSLRWDRFERSEFQARLMNNVVVVVGNLHFKYTCAQGSNAEMRLFPRDTGILHFTHVWAMRDTKWKLAVVHNSIVPGDAL